MPFKPTYELHYKSVRKVYNLDVQIISSSRPECLKKMYKSFKRCIFTNANLRVMLHDDILNLEKSREVWRFAEAYETSSKFFNEFYSSQPPIGNSAVMHFLIKRWRTDYVFHIQDDWEFELPIDLDRILWTMDNHPEIHCIFFNKQANRVIGDFDPIEVEFEGLRMCTSYFWPFLPGIWRTHTFKSKWQFRPDRPEGYFNQQFGTADEIKELAKKDKFGVYSLGDKFHPRYVRHLGENLTTLHWKPDNRKTVNKKYSMSDLRYRAPWLPQPKELINYK